MAIIKQSETFLKRLGPIKPTSGGKEKVDCARVEEPRRYKDKTKSRRRQEGKVDMNRWGLC